MVDPLIIGAIVVGALSAASYYQQRKMQRQAEKQANEMASHQISGHDSNRALYTVYGRALIGTTTIYKRVSRRNIPMANANFTNFVGGGGSPSTESKTYGLNRFLYRISSLSNGPINGIENVLIDGEKYTANRFTAGHSKHFEAAVSLGPTAGNHFANLRTSYATDFSAWGADKKGQGVAYVVERFWFDKSNPAYQGEPSTQYLVKGRSLYDPRLDSTVSGGSGSHRSDTPSTWSFSDNPALALLDMLTNNEYGRGVSHADCNMATFIAAANKCDVLVDIPARATNTTGATMVVYDPHAGTTYEIPDNGTITNYRVDQQTTGPNANKQKRFRLNMAVDNSKEVLDNIQQILQSFRGNLHHINGEYVVHMDDVASPVLTLTDDDIIGGLKIAQGDRKQRINRMTVKFLNANKHYKTDQVSWPPIDSDSSSQYQTYLTADSGEKLHKTVTLTGCTDYYQAEDIAEYLVRESRVTLAVSGTFGSRCFNLVPGDVIALSYDSAGYNGKYFIVDQVGVDVASMNVKLSLREYDSSVYTWNTARGNEPVALYFDEEQQYNATPTSLTLGTVSSAVVTLADGTATVSLVVNYSGVPEEATAVEIGWAPTGTSEYTTNVMQEDATKTKFQLGIDNQDIDIRVRYIVTNADGLQMPSGYATTTFTLPAVSGTRLGGMDDNATRNTGVLADRDTVDTVHIEADAVTAAKIDVTNIAAINADLGAITSGTLQNSGSNAIPSNIFTRSTSRNIPTGNESGTFVDLSSGNFVFGNAATFLSFANNTNVTPNVFELDVKGVLAPTVLDLSSVTDETVMPSTIKAQGFVPASIPPTALSDQVWNQIDGLIGQAGTGFYVTASDVYLGEAQKIINLGSTPNHRTGDITVQVVVADSFSSDVNFAAGSDALKIDITLQYKLASASDYSNAVTISTTSGGAAGASQKPANPKQVLSGTLYSINESITVTLTSGVGQDIADGTDLDFRVILERVGSQSAFATESNGGANDTNGTPVTLQVSEGAAGIVATAGNAETLDNLDSTQFLRSDTDDTFGGDLTITGDLSLTGNFNITGDINSHSVNDLDVTDRTITVNAGGSNATSDGAGLVVDRGTAANVSLTWDETNDKFTVTNEFYAPTIAGDDLVLREWTGGSAYSGLAHKDQSGTEYMIISRDDHTYISATTGYDVKIRGGNNVSTYEISVYPDQDATASGNKIWHGGDFTSTNITQWNTAYTYSQVGHVPLAGGTMTGQLNIHYGAPTLKLKDTTDNDDHHIQFTSSTDAVVYSIDSQNATSGDAFTFYSSAQEIVQRIGSENILEAHAGVVKSKKPLEVTGSISSGAITSSASVIASGNSNSFGNTTISNLTVTSVTASGSITATGNSNSFGNTTLGTTTTGALTATNITANSLSLSGAFTPSSLTTTGDVSAAGFRASYGSESDPAYTFKNDDDTGMFGSINRLGFSVSGDEKIQIQPQSIILLESTTIQDELKVGTVPQTVITSSRALQNISSITSGPITASSTITNDSPSHSYLVLDNGGSHESGIIFKKNGTSKWEAPYISSGNDNLKFYSYVGSGLQMTIRSGLNGNGGTIFSGLGVSDSSAFYGDYGALLLNTNQSYTSTSRGWMITNAYETNKFAILYSNSATSLPALTTYGAAATGTSVALEIDNTGNLSSGAITSSGRSTFDSVTIDDDGSSSPLLRIIADDASPWLLQLQNASASNGGLFQTYINNDNNLFMRAKETGAYPTWYFQISNDSNHVTAMYLNSSGINSGGHVAAAQYKIGTTTVIDANRNLTNIGTINSGSILSSGQSFFGNSSGIKGTSTDATLNVSYFTFYESDATTRQGYIGYGQSSNQTLYINNDLDAEIVLRVNASNRITITDTSTTIAGNLSSGAITSTGTSTIDAIEIDTNYGVRFGHANQVNSDDGRISAGRHGTGLNIVGAQTSSGTGRQVRIWGDVITDGGNPYVIGNVSNAINMIITGVMQSNIGYKVGSSAVIDSSRNIFAKNVTVGTNSTLIRSEHHSGHLEGSYNNVGANHAKSNPIYTIGSSYNPTDAALSNMYGIGFAKKGNATYLAGFRQSGWGMYVASDGDARVFLNAQTGVVASTAGYDVGATNVIDTSRSLVNIHDITFNGVVRSTNNANVDGPNFNVSTTNKSTSEYAYRVDRSGTVVGGIRIDGALVANGATFNSSITVHGGGNQSQIRSSSDAPLRVQSTDAVSGMQFIDPNGTGSLYYIGSINHLYLHNSSFSVAGSSIASGYAFQVNGAARTTGNQRVDGRTFLQNGTAALPALTFTNDQNTGLYRVGEDQFGWVVAGSRKFYTSNVRAFFQNLSEGVDVPSLRISGTTVIDASRNIFVKDVTLGTNSTLIRSDHQSGHLEGSYNNVGNNATKSNPIYTIGSIYNPGDAELSNMYGIGFARQGSATYLSDFGSGGWGLYVAADGNARVFLDSTNGIIASTGGYHVANTEIVSSTRRFYASSGTTVKAAYSFDGDSTTGMIRPAASSLGFLTGGVQAATINSSGITVTGTGTFSGTITTTGGNIGLRRNNNGDGTILRDIEFLNSFAQGADDRAAIIRAQNQGGGADSRGGKLVFYTRQANSAGFNSMVLDNAGLLSAPSVSSTGYKIGTTTVIDNGRNLLSIGSISASTLTTSGDITVNGNQVFMNASNDRVKFAVWSNNTYGTGMTNGVSFGGIGAGSSEYAMTFQMSNTNARGFVWLDTGHTLAQGAMALTTQGLLTVAGATRIGYGQSDTTAPDSATAMLNVNGLTRVNSAELQISSSSAFITHFNFQNSGKNFISQAVSGGQTLIRNNNAVLFSVGSTGNVTIGTETTNANLIIKKADDNVADHIKIFCGSTQTGSIGSQDTTWLRINQTVNKNIYTPRYIRADSGFFVDNTATGLDGSGRLRAFAGSTSAVGIGFANDIDTGFYRPAANTIDVVTAGDAHARFDSTGNLIVEGNVTAFGSVSDIRLKKGIQRITDPVSKVQQLDGVTFQYKKTGAKATGLIAQQLLEVLPEVVYEETDIESGKSHYAVRYGQVVGLLVEAIKDQQDQIDSLKSIIEEMKNGNH